MRWFCLSFLPAFCSLLAPISSRAQILLNELYYDHPGRDEGHEFVELINIGSTTESLFGLAIDFYDGAAGWKTIWRAEPSESLAAWSLYTIGGDLVSPLPDVTLALGLQNGPDAVRVVKEGIELDRVGYGLLGDDRYYEGEAAPDVSDGLGLSRMPDGADSNNNAADFRPARPTPGKYNVARYDISLRPGSGTRIRDVAPSPVGEIRVRLINGGQGTVEAGAVEVELYDSTLTMVRQVGALLNRSHIGVGDSLDLEYAVTLDPGYHWLVARGHYPGDERPGDNRLIFVRRRGDPAILVSEVMSSPQIGCPEYVEFYNAGSSSVDLRGYRLRDRAHEGALITGRSLVLPSGRFLVVTDDVMSLRQWFAGVDPSIVIPIEGSWPSLNSSGSGHEADSVLILDRFGLSVDRVAYPPQDSDARGQSLERVDLYPGVRSHAWVLSQSPGGGSPGERGETSLTRPPDEPGMSLSPNPFVPASGDRLLVSLSSRSQPARTVVRVFDINGRRIREIGATIEHPFVFTWDGRDEHGDIVSPGIYIVFCESVALDTGSRVVEKEVLGCVESAR